VRERGERECEGERKVGREIVRPDNLKTIIDKEKSYFRKRHATGDKLKIHHLHTLLIIHTHTYICVCMQVYIYMSIYICVCMHTSTCVNIYLFKSM
jgi:hypothetical protein